MGIFDVKTAVVLNSRSNRDSGVYEEVNPEFCDCCGHEIIWDDEEYCPFCGEELKKELRPKGSVKAGSSGGGVLLLVLAAVVVIWLLAR